MPTGGQQPQAFGSRPFAALKPLAAQLPSQVQAQKPDEAGRTFDPRSPTVRALSGRIVISRESKGRAGKTVTFARGIVGSEALLEKLAKELRHELGTGVRVEEGVLAVQGALSDRLAACLVRRGAARIVIGN